MIGVITGPVSCGKSLMLASQARATGATIMSFNPDSDLVSKSDLIETRVKSPLEILPKVEKHLEETDPPLTVAIDNAHLFSRDLVPVVLDLHFKYGCQVLVAGESKDWLNKPFPVMAEILAYADQAAKLKTDCAYCESKNGYYTIEINTEEGIPNIRNPICVNCYKTVMRNSKVQFDGDNAFDRLAVHAINDKKVLAESENV